MLLNNVMDNENTNLFSLKTLQMCSVETIPKQILLQFDMLKSLYWYSGNVCIN